MKIIIVITIIIKFKKKTIFKYNKLFNERNKLKFYLKKFIMNSKRAELLAKLKERRNKLNIMQRAREIVETSQKKEEFNKETPEGEQIIKKKKPRLYPFKIESYYTKKSQKNKQVRTAEMQTEPVKHASLLNVNSRKQSSREGMKSIIRHISLKPGSLYQGRSSILFQKPSRNKEDIKKLKDQLKKPEMEYDEDDKKVEEGEVNTVDMLKSEKFNEFFLDASKYVEKILDEDTDKKQDMNEGNCIETEIEFKLPKNLKNVCVSHLAWSNLMPEVFLSVYLDKDDVSKRNHQTNDIFYIWNTEFQKRPEFELHSTSKIQTAIFSPFSSETVIAGCESGSISIYDLRAKKDPVLKSIPSIEAHRTPVVGLKIIGGRNSNNLISISEEGRLCIWSIHNITMPLRKVDLIPPVPSQEKANEFEFLLEPFSLSSIPGDTSSVFVGTNDNSIYKYMVLSGDSQTKGVKKTFKSHQSIVNTMDHNRASNISSQISSLMLSGSLDWTIKLWNGQNENEKDSLLYTFYNHQNPITCVHWNPLHPLMFSSADSAGNVNVVNLFKNFDEPVYKTKYSNTVFNSKWDSSGRILGITDDSGNIMIKRFKKEFFDYDQSDLKNYESVINQK